MIDLIVSQGRVADRAARMIEGAARTARALEQRYGITGHYVGKVPAALPACDDWSVSLPQARETLAGLNQAMTASVKTSSLSVMVANTCSASLATLPVVAQAFPDAVVLYIDAHGDFNTPETTKSGYLGGMVLSAACGLWDSGHGAGLRPEQAILIGARDLDPDELELLQAAGVRIISPAEATAENILNAVDGARVWIHIDWDVLEPGFVPADYTVPDGITPAQIRAILESIPPSRVLGIEVAEFNAPLADADADDAVSILLDILAPALEAAQAR